MFQWEGREGGGYIPERGERSGGCVPEGGERGGGYMDILLQTEEIHAIM